MAEQFLAFGSLAANDGEYLPTAFAKIQANFDELYQNASGYLTGSSTRVGFRLNSLTTAQRNALAALAGSLAYNASTGVPNVYAGAAWQAIGLLDTAQTWSALQTYAGGIATAGGLTTSAAGIANIRLQDTTGQGYFDFYAQDFYDQGGYGIHNTTLQLQYNFNGAIADYPKWGENWEMRYAVIGTPPVGVLEKNWDYSGIGITISGVANNGGGLYRLTVPSSATLTTGDSISIVSVVGSGGMTAAINTTWVITVIDGTRVDLQGSTFAGTFTSAGLLRVIYRPFNFNIDHTTYNGDFKWRLGEWAVWSRTSAAPVMRVSTAGNVVSVYKLNIGGETTTANQPFNVIGTFTGGAFARFAPTAMTDGDIAVYAPLPTVAGAITGFRTQGTISGILDMLVLNGGAGGAKIAALGGSAGDAWFRTLAGTDWSFGADRSDSGNWKLSNADTLGTNDVLTLTAAGNATIAGSVTPTGGVAAGGGFSASPRNCHSGNTPARASTDGTNATPVTTEFYFAEVFIPVNCTATGVAVFWGDASSGNAKVGLANSAGAVVATSASAGQIGTDAYQLIPFTGTYAAKGPATYFVLLSMDNNTVRFNTHTIGSFGTGKATGQVYATGFTAITPPTAFTAALGPIASLY